MFCTSCGTRLAEGSAFCTHCGQPVAPDAALSTLKPGAAGDAIPEGVQGWSWGAFLLTWIWAIGNRTWIGLLTLIPYVGFGVAIWLGIKGREMAWKNKQWDSLEHFNRVQKSWSRWGVGIVFGGAMLGILAAVAIPAYDSYTKRARQAQAQAESSLELAADSGNDAGNDADRDSNASPNPASAAAITDSGPIDSNADTLPTALVTSAGMLKRSEETPDQRHVVLNGTPLFTGEDANWQFPVRSFTLSGNREAVLMASSGGRGNSCETLFFFLLIDKKDVHTTPHFGTCAPQGKFVQNGDTIALELPRMGGMSNFELRDGAVFEDGKQVTLDDSNDPAK